jgi:hypothetical protein
MKKETIEEIAEEIHTGVLHEDYAIADIVKLIKQALSSGPSEGLSEFIESQESVPPEFDEVFKKNMRKLLATDDTPKQSENEIMKHQINMSPPTEAEKVAAYHYNYMANTQLAATPKPSEGNTLVLTDNGNGPEYSLTPKLDEKELEDAAKASNCYTFESQRGFYLGYRYAKEEK